jgi:hypothetical protein
MSRIVNVQEVPVGGVYRVYNAQSKELQGPELTVLEKGVKNGTGFNLSALPGGQRVQDFHFKYRNPVMWLNAPE